MSYYYRFQNATAQAVFLIVLPPAPSAFRLAGLCLCGRPCSPFSLHSPYLQTSLARGTLGRGGLLLWRV